MPDTGVTSNDPVPTLEDVGHEFPDWHCYAPGISGTVFASPPRQCPTRHRAGIGSPDPA